MVKEFFYTIRCIHTDPTTYFVEKNIDIWVPCHFFIIRNSFSLPTENNSKSGLTFFWSKPYLQGALTFLQSCSWLRNPCIICRGLTRWNIFVSLFAMNNKRQCTLINIKPFSRLVSSTFIIITWFISASSNTFFSKWCLISTVG